MSRAFEQASRGTVLGPWLEETRCWVDAWLDRLMPGEEEHPARLHAAMRYALFGGGKRLRPALVRLVGQAFGADDEALARPAVAVELVHTYSLVHDDLPCMDDDALRRGRPTCHVAFDEATAVLTGDALLTQAFEVLARGEAAGALAASLARAAGSLGMVGGQVLDLSLEGGTGLDLAVLRDMHARKTAALFEASAAMGALAAGAAESDAGRAGAFGRALGLAFQAVDDLLDETGDAGTLGKTPGKDASLERPSLVSVVGLEGGRQQAERLSAEARRSLEDLGAVAPGGLGLAGELVAFVLERRA